MTERTIQLKHAGFQGGYGADYGGGRDFDNFDLRRNSQSYHCPEPVANFILHLYKSINNRDLGDIENLYEVRFPQLNRDYFKEEKWPYDIEHLVDDPLVKKKQHTVA